MDPEQKSIRDKSIYLLRNVILFSIIYSFVAGWIRLLNPETWIQDWEVGMIGMVIFSALYIIDRELPLFRYDLLNEFMISFFLSWFLSDIGDFFLLFGTQI